MAENPSEGRYRVGMIGCGMMGMNHARSYKRNPSTQIVAGADPDEVNLRRFTETFGVPGYTDYNEMLAREAIDIAAPVLPVRANADAVVASARAGVKAVFCDKPLTASLQDADRMVEECETRGVYFYGGHTFRNYPQMWKAREIIESGEIGEVQSINLYDGNGQGGCHSISVARMFAGDADVDCVVGWVEGDPFSDWEGSSYREEANDVGCQRIGGVLRFANGLDCFSHYKTDRYGIEVLCSRGAFTSDLATFHLFKTVEGGLERLLKDQQEVEGLFLDVETYDDNGRFDDEGWAIPENRLNDTVQRVVDSLDNGTAPSCSGDDLRKALEIVIALRESHRRGHVPIHLPLADRSLALYPEALRWNNKKDYLSDEWYEENMKQFRRSEE